MATKMGMAAGGVSSMILDLIDIFLISMKKLLNETKNCVSVEFLFGVGLFQTSSERLICQTMIHQQ